MIKSTYFDLKGTELSERPESGEYIEEYIGDATTSSNITAGHYIVWTKWNNREFVDELNHNPWQIITSQT